MLLLLGCSYTLMLQSLISPTSIPIIVPSFYNWTPPIVVVSLLCDDLMRTLNTTLRKLKSWSRKSFGNVADRVQLIKDELLFLQHNPPSDDNREKIAALTDKFNELTDMEATFWQQRAHSQYIKDYDRNTKYFHASATNRRVVTALGLFKCRMVLGPRILKYNTCNSILAILGVKVMSVDDKYLGHTLLKPKSRVASYDDLLEKCRTRLQSWMSSYLSHAGIIIRDYRGSFIAGNCFFDGQWTGIDGALEAEARAFLKGLELARDLRFHTVTLEGDSQMIVSYLTDDRLKFPWRIRSVILDCREIMSSFNHIQIQHVTRKANQAAHQLAAYAFSSRSCFSWRGLAPSCITSTLLADMSTHVVS
ncbi:hypothetical protein BVC80_9081g62 [Macleaya cordata]|uniref:RNase H type-1 domain-containing protein n=1 Tax=Macleaya cordata TaxID=56857 RepID=A0A200PRR0_MACCD|nr:hypothetical protein BVC80_9081g62 [Macleaya cordata]